MPATETQDCDPQHTRGGEFQPPNWGPDGLPEKDQVFLLLVVPKEMYQLVKLLICLTYLQQKKESF